MPGPPPGTGVREPADRLAPAGAREGQCTGGEVRAAVSLLREYAGAVAQPTLPFPGETGVPARYDEVVGPDGSLRPAWRTVAEAALGLTPDELHRVDGEIVRFLADDGVTYMRRDRGAQPWQLDPVPLIIDAATWSDLDVGLAQRTELLNALLADLYGPRRLLATGVVPAAAVVGHSGFLRPLARGAGDGGVADSDPLTLAAADLGRDAHGAWHVLADRVQAPSGLGYAMQNRRVISQVLPELYQEGDLHRVEPYFAAVRAALIAAAPASVAVPRVVVLSPGTHSETAFDQAFLANALGFPLVQGSDLVVRDGSVWMKPSRWPRTAPTERVDVILRRTDAEWCDPLELRAGSRLGVAGLVEAVRRGRVRVVNGLGAGVLENPALLPYLPAACGRLLGEELRLPSVPTDWCGDPVGRERVLERLEDPSLIVRTIDQPRKALAGLSPDELRRRILAAPHRFVGQERLPLSQAPVWGAQGRIDAQALVFRAFTVRLGSAYRPLVGGLATVRDRPDDQPTAKDVWVLKASAGDADQGIAEIAPVAVARTVPAFAPRALDDMYWAGRYAERAEDLLRLLLAAYGQLDAFGAGADGRASVRVMFGAIRRLAGRRADDAHEELRSLLLDADRRGGVAHALARLRDVLEGVRDQLSGDTWRVFSNVDRAAKALRSSTRAHRSAESAGRMLVAVLSLHGVTANMIRDAGWHMIEAGRSLERALQVCLLVTSAMVDARDPQTGREVLDAVLVASESVVTHRRRYRGSLRVADALELLLTDRDNPRSLAFALDRVRLHLAALPGSTGSTRPERLIERLQRTVDAADPALLEAPTDGRRYELAEFLDSVQGRAGQLSDAIADLHFAAGPVPQALSALALVEEMGARA